MNKDKCVICGIETQYDQSTSVDFRFNYVDGMGQLCGNCYKKGSTPIEHISIPKEYLTKYSNDMELGGAVRQFYNQHYKY
jgi:hypothetical protein